MYLFNAKFQKEGLENIKESIELSLEEYIPIPAIDTIFDYEILEENEKHVKVEVNAIQKNIIEDYISIFKNSSILVKSFELEAQAISRAVIKKGDMGTYMIVDFGERRSGIFIVSRGIVVFTSTLDVGGVLLTNMISKSFKISFEEAEKMKKKYGLERNTGNSEIFPVILNSVSSLRDEIVKHYVYWHTHKDEEVERPKIEKIILCGGDSNLIGLSEYLSVSTRNKVEMANTWINIADIEKNIPEMKFENSLSFACAIGLALGNFKYD